MTDATMLATRFARRAPISRKKLMMSCASFALAAAALQPQSAHAQAFAGSITSSTGSVSRVTPTSTTETLTIGSNTATINWSPTNQQGTGTINFLPAGNIATFTSAPGITDYTVLNRIVPTDAARGISLNGHVISTLQGTSTTGGRIWFYSPGGIVIGSTAVFDVGSLLLTTNDLVGAEGPFVRFRGATGSTSKIQVQSGAQINALQPGSYVAMIAPRVEQGGKVRVNGTAAYVAGEQVSMTINQGLFDISVDIGTTDHNGIVHTGETSGPGNTAATDNHSIYMVAVPKNQALEMLLGGKVGFDGASSAEVRNGQIILSAGYGTQGANFSQSYLGGAVTGTPADMTISGGTFTSDVKAAATGNIWASGGGGTLAFSGNVSMQGLESASLTADEGETVTVGGNLVVSADDIRSFSTTDSEVGIDAFAGTAVVQAFSGGSIQVAGSATVSANAGSAINTATATSGASEGGWAMLESGGGSITVGGPTTVSASALGAASSGPVNQGGDALGGYANVEASFGGSIQLGGTLDVLAEGEGSFTTVCCGGTGGAGYGGSAGISAFDGGLVSVTGSTLMSATGFGGAVVTSPDGTGGDGHGGYAFLDASFGGNITFGSSVDIFSQGEGGNAVLYGGNGFGSSADIFIDGGSISAAGGLSLLANGYGGTGLVAGDGYDGSASLQFSGGEGEGGGGSLSVGGATWLQATGTGGDGLDNAEGTGGQGGDGFGGSTFFYVSPYQTADSTLAINLHDTFVTTNANGGAGGDGLTGGNGGNAFSGGFFGDGGEGGFYGGNSTFELWSGNASFGELQVYSTSRGGAGGAGSSGAGGNGGDATGGQSSVYVGGGLTSTRISSYDRAFGGSGGSGTTQGNGGSAQGGSAGVAVFEGGQITGNVDIATTAFGGLGDIGGDATGGFNTLSVEGTLTGGLVVMDASGFGGAGVTQGGNANGGWADFEVFGGSVALNNPSSLTVTAVGGDASSGTGGYAIGGSAMVEAASGGSLTGGTLSLDTSATGGNGATAGYAGGGRINVFEYGFGSDLPSSITLTSLNLISNGTIGTGSASELFGYGGSIDVFSAGGTINAQTFSAQANGSTFGGSISLASEDFGDGSGSLAFGTTTGVANGADLGGFIFVTTTPGTTIDLGNATLTATGAESGQILLAAGAGCDCVDGEAQSADLPSGGGIAASNLTLNTSGNIMLTLGGGADIAVAGTLTGTAGQTISLIEDGTGGAIRGHIIDLTAMTILDNADIIADIIRFTSRSSMTLGNLTASDAITLTSGGDLETGDLTAANALTLDSDGNVDAGNLKSQNVTVTADGAIAVHGASAGAIRLTSGGAMTLGDSTASDLITLIAGGDLHAGNLTATNALTMDSKGDLFAGNLASNLVNLKAGSDLTVNNVNAGASAAFTAGDLAKFTGTVRSPTITVTSGDIDIAEGAALGVFGVTNLVTLNAVSHGLPILIGDGGSANAGAPGQYHLDEDGDIHSAAVVINAIGASEGQKPDVRVFNVEIDGSATSGGGIGSVTLNTPGSIFVEGDVAYTSAAATDTLTLNAGPLIEVNTDTGSIVMADGAGHLTGTLALNADNVWIASGSLLDQLEANPNFPGRDAALATSSGTPNQDGFVRAGTITSRVVNSFLAQNSGTPTLFAGIDAGAGGLSINSAGTTPATLIVYGRQTTANGTVITNDAFLDTVNLQGTGGFTNDSAVNGCTIGATCGQPVSTPGIDMASILGPLDETNSPDDEEKKKDDEEGDEGDDGSNVDPSLRLINTTPVTLDHQIDEPVTSGGDIVIGGGPNSPN